MMASAKVASKNFKRILFLLAFLQIFGWTFDVTENYYLLKWLKSPVIGEESTFYHIVVYSKWIIALTGALLAIVILVGSVFKRKNLKSAI
jgi:hypothetical protein